MNESRELGGSGGWPSLAGLVPGPTCYYEGRLDRQVKMASSCHPQANDHNEKEKRWQSRIPPRSAPKDQPGWSAPPCAMQALPNLVSVPLDLPRIKQGLKNVLADILLPFFGRGGRDKDDRTSLKNRTGKRGRIGGGRQVYMYGA